jgi:hypothetical protein
MQWWKMAEEPTLQELLDDEIMRPVMKSAGLDASELRALLRELASRVTAPEGFRRRLGCSPECGLRPSAA